MAREDTNSLRVIITLESLKKIDLRDMENFFGKMEIFTKVSGKAIWFMVMDNSIIKMEESMKETSN